MSHGVHISAHRFTQKMFRRGLQVFGKRGGLGGKFV
jgi:hypothetical protein